MNRFVILLKNQGPKVLVQIVLSLPGILMQFLGNCVGQKREKGFGFASCISGCY